MHPKTSRVTSFVLTVLLAVAASIALPTMQAQVLARPGWAGSGVTVDPWWKHAVIYEIYPRSFQDSNGDGIGDLKGITKRLGYLESLGVDAIWLTPIYPSPQVDFGYDISNYEAIDPQYGTMDDFEDLVKEAGRHNIRIIMDMVMNHTSDQHPWFKESESSLNNPKRDWYIWRDGKGPGQPPNNWESLFGHSAWQYDAKTNQWYYHKFYPQQPDLNWRNPEVEQAMFNVIRFWLNRGVAGFRLDAVPVLFEDPSLKDETLLPGTNAYGDPNQDDSLTNNLPEVHNVLRDLRKLTNSYPGTRVLIGETYLDNVGQLAKMYGKNNDELQLPMDMQVGFINKLDASEFRQRIQEAETGINGNQPLFVFDNHDNPRSWDRYGDGVHNEAIAKVLATILFTTRSTAMMYYGQELGMDTTTPTSKAEVKDPIGILGWPKEKGRDGERTPMQWDENKYANFSVAKPWLPIPNSYKTVNVADESKDPHSLLNWYKQLIALRRSDPAIREGANIMLNHDDQNVLAWLRRPATGTTVLIACNFTAEPRTISFKQDLRQNHIRGAFLRTLLRSDPSIQPTMDIDAVTLQPFGVYIGEVRF
ncbi:MAG: alpha-glucosidase [Acidobacteriaceae bacterium]